MKIIDKNGFTLVELMIAIVVFTVLLLLSSASITQISRLYYKGIILSKTQSVARNVSDNISQSIQFSSGDISTNKDSSGRESICIGNTRYTYILNKQIKTGNDHALWRDKIGGVGACPPLNISDTTALKNSIEGVELLEPGMRLKSLSIDSLSIGAIGNKIVNIDLAVIYGDDDLINFQDIAKTKPMSCKGYITGSQWCATSSLYTQVFSRVKS